MLRAAASRRTFLAHYGAALGAKRVAPRVSLGVLVAAAHWLDLLRPIFLLAGWHLVPWAARVDRHRLVRESAPARSS